MEKIFDISEREYRKIGIDSYSTLKVLDESPLKYKKMFIDKEKTIVEDKNIKDELRFGNLVDCLLSNPEEKDKMFINSTEKCPSGQYGDFLNNLISFSAPHIKEDVAIPPDIWANICIKAFNKTKYNGKGTEIAYKGKTVEDVMKDFDAKIGETYFKESLEILCNNKIPIFLGEEEKAERLVAWVKNHPYTAHIFKKRAVFNQYPLIDKEGEIFGTPIKGLLDKVEYNVKERWIQPYDLKTTGMYQLFFKNFFNLRYDIQNGVYYKLLEHFFPKWEIRPMKFIVIDKSMGAAPFILETDKQHVNWSIQGFFYKGRHYKGINTLVQELNYYKTSGDWATDIELQKNNGVLKLNLFSGI